MLEAIVLLTGSVERPMLTQRLLAAAPELTIIGVETLAELEALGARDIRNTRLVGFATPVIVPAGLLAAFGRGAYNFHPGPPEFPGYRPAAQAIYCSARQFGATAHHMAARVDAGPIVDVVRFAVPAGTRPEALEVAAYRALIALFWRLSARLATCVEPIEAQPIAWSAAKSSRRSYAALCDIAPGIAAAELARRVAAFGSGAFGVRPTMRLHGHAFTYAEDDPATDAEGQG